MRVGVIYHSTEEFEKAEQITEFEDYEMYETANAVSDALSQKGYDAEPVRIKNAQHSPLLKQLDSMKKKFDLIFHLAESDGNEAVLAREIAAYLKQAGVPFTGCGDEAIGVCTDKMQTKKIFMANGIPTPRFQLFTDEKQQLDPDLRFPLIAKPVHEDGSYGITVDSVVKNPGELKRIVARILKENQQPALVEEFIDGREINAAVIGTTQNPKVFPLSEIIFDFPASMPKIVSFEAKWDEKSMMFQNTRGECPAKIPKETEEKIIALTKKAFKATGCRDYARVDFRIRGNEIYVLEVNPNPWISPNGAGFINSAKAAGYEYADIINKILTIALRRSKLENASACNSQ